jgi:hypothetical protein
MNRRQRELIYLIPGTKFHTCLTNRAGIVLPQDRDEGTGVHVILDSPPEKKYVFGDCLVYPDVIFPEMR